VGRAGQPRERENAESREPTGYTRTYGGVRVIVPLVASIVCALAVQSTDPSRAAALRAQAFEAAYNLDHDRALELFEKALAASRDDLASHRGIALVQLLEITFARGTIAVEEFLSDTRPAGSLPPPPAKPAQTFHAHIDRAFEISEAWARTRPQDVEAHYQLGAVLGLLASYTGTVEGRTFAAFRVAKRAFDEHERVLALDPARQDAALIVGTYRYVVSTLWGPTRVMAYLAGFGGGRERGLALVETAAQYGSDARVEAKLALIVLYNRERRYDEAFDVLTELRGHYPRNRLLWLESAATALRAHRAAEADALLVEAMDRFGTDTRPRAFGELALWRYTRGLARLELGDLQGARTSLTQALEGDARTWVRARTHLALGRVAERTGDRAGARTAYETAARLADTGRDPAAAADARARMDRLGR